MHTDGQRGGREEEFSATPYIGPHDTPVASRVLANRSMSQATTPRNTASTRGRGHKRAGSSPVTMPRMLLGSARTQQSACRPRILEWIEVARLDLEFLAVLGTDPADLIVDEAVGTPGETPMLMSAANPCPRRAAAVEEAIAGDG